MIILIVSVVGVIRWVFIRWCTTLRWRDIALLRFTPVKWWTMDWNAKDGCTGMSIVFTNRLQTLIFLSTKEVNSSAPRIFGLQMNQLTRWLDVTRQWLGHVFWNLLRLHTIWLWYYMFLFSGNLLRLHTIWLWYYMCFFSGNLLRLHTIWYYIFCSVNLLITYY